MIARNKKSILLVEDEALIAMAKQAELSQYGYDVFISHSGEEAIDFCSDNSTVDLILMDIDLGLGIDGTLAAEKILQDHDIPVLFLSSHTEPEVVGKTERITFYGYVVKSSSITVLDASIKMAFRLFDEKQKVKEHRKALESINDELIKSQKEIENQCRIISISEERFSTTLNDLLIGVVVHDSDSSIIFSNLEARKIFGLTKDQILGKKAVDPTWNFVHEDLFKLKVEDYPVSKVISTGTALKDYIIGISRPDREYITWVNVSAIPTYSKDKKLETVIINFSDITSQKRAEDALERRLSVLTKPLENVENIRFDELFDIEEIQQLQNEFSNATGVASIITDIDGKPITEPSNFCRLCNDIIRKTEKGKLNCFKSDAALGKVNRDGPNVKPCLSGGLWDAGASITIGQNHIANWLIGQVRDETQTEEKIKRYAKEIDANVDEVVEAFNEVTPMSLKRFKEISQVLFTLSNLISNMAYQNIKQTSFINDIYLAEESLKRERDHQASILANISDVIAIMDSDGIIQYKSPNIANVFGWKPEDLVGKSGWETVHPDDIERLKELFQIILEKDNLQLSVEYRYMKKDGTYAPIELTATNLISNPNINGVLLDYHDISDRKIAEDALYQKTLELEKSKIQTEESEERYRALHNASFGGIAIHDKGIILDCNTGLSEITGYEFDELVGMNGLLLIAEDYRDLVMEKIVSDYKKPYEAMGVRKNGEEYHLRLEARNIPYKQKRVRVVEFRDITERKESEIALRDSENKFKNLFNNINIGVALHEIVLDENNKPVDYIWLDVNPEYERLTQLKASDIIGKRVLEVIPNLEKRWIEIFGGVALSGVEISIEDYSEYFDKYWDVKAYSPKKNHFAVAIADITEKMNSDIALQEALNEKQSLLNELQHRAKNSFKLITSMIGLISNANHSKETHHVLEEINSRIMAVSEMYDLIYYTKSLTDVNLHDYFERVYLSLSGLTTDIILERSFESVTVPVKKAIPLGLIIVELVTNSIKYAFPQQKDGLISIVLSEKDSIATLIVKDNGIGFSEEFDLATVSTMGLTIVKALTAQIEGNLTRSTVDGAGFSITFEI